MIVVNITAWNESFVATLNDIKGSQGHILGAGTGTSEKEALRALRNEYLADMRRHIALIDQELEKHT